MIKKKKKNHKKHFDCIIYFLNKSTDATTSWIDCSNLTFSCWLAVSIWIKMLRKLVILFAIAFNCSLLEYHLPKKFKEEGNFLMTITWCYSLASKNKIWKSLKLSKTPVLQFKKYVFFWKKFGYKICGLVSNWPARRDKQGKSLQVQFVPKEKVWVLIKYLHIK